MTLPKRHGFTLVELLIIIAIIGILSSIAFFSFNTVRVNARDSEKSADIETVAEELEKYYEKNGEYPGCKDMSQPASVVASEVLVGINPKTLSISSSDNSFMPSCGDLTTESSSSFAYVGDGTEDCLSGSACTKYTLKYVKESSSEIIAVASKHNAVTPADAPAEPSQAPIISVILNGSNVEVATTTPAICPAGTVQYSTDSQINSDGWLGYSAWSTDLTASQAANDGVKYSYRAKARCYVDETHISTTVTSPASTYIDPIDTVPSAPTVTATTVGSTTTYAWTEPTCPAGTSARYQYRYTISPAGYDSGLTAIATSPLDFTTSTDGQTYTVAVQAQCYNANASSNWGTAGSASYVLLASPSTPVTTVALNGSDVQATITPATCAAGTAQYGIAYRLNGGSWTDFSNWSTDVVYSQIANDGVLYGYKAQARCYIDDTQISSTKVGSEATYVDPVATPSAPSISAATVGATTTYSWIAPTCPTDTSARYQYRYTISPSGYDSGLTAVAASPLGFTTSTEDQTYTVAIQAQCYNTNTASDWSSANTASYYRPIVPTDAPSIPSIAVTINGANVQATITPVTCTTGTAEYGIDYQLNGGAWTGYSAWSTELTASQTANDGVLYGYRAQARCYVDATHISTTTTSSTATYIDPINTVPAAPTVTATTAGDSTTYSWTAPTCPANTSARYQYQYTISPAGYDSGLTAVASSPLVFTTSTENQTYTVAIQAQCYNANASGNWSGIGSDSYARQASSSNTFALSWGSANGKDQSQSIIQTSDGGYAITGDITNNGAGSTDAFIAKFASDGTLSWSKTWGGTNYDYSRSIIQTADGGFIITGVTYSYGASIGNEDVFIAKFASDGTLSWSKTWGGIAFEAGNNIIQDSDGNYIVAGDTAMGGAYDNMLLAKYDISGNLIWNVTWGDSLGGAYNPSNSVVQVADGGYAVTGFTNSFGAGSYDMYIAKYDASGNLVWKKTWGGTNIDQGNSIILTNDNNLIVTGNTTSYGAGGSDMFIAKYTTDGNLVWSKTWGGTNDDFGMSVIQAGDNNLVVTGTTNSYGAGGSDMFIAKYTTDGNLVWSKTWGGTDNDSGTSIAKVSNGGLIVTGNTYSYGTGTYNDVFFVKYDDNGMVNNCMPYMCADITPTVTSPSATESIPSTDINTWPTATETSPSPVVTIPSMTAYTLIPAPSQPLSAPYVTVALDSTNVLATITPVACNTGTAQYSIRSRTNDGSWGNYTTWSTTLTASQAASSGVKYGYQAQARCYYGSYSTIVTSTESTYINPIPAPTLSTVNVYTSGDNTTWSWSTSCPSGTVANYQYDYTITPSGYDSGWVNNGTSNSAAFNTATSGQTYTVTARADCTNANTTSEWSGNKSNSYYRGYATTLSTVLPNAYITYSGTAPTTTTVGNIDNTVAGYDSTYFVAGANSTGTAYYELTDMPSDFVSIASLNYSIRYKITPITNDTETLSIRIYKSDRTTVLTNIATVESTKAAVAETSKINLSFTGVTSGTKADWDGAVLAITTNHIATASKDGSVWSINEIEFSGVYYK